MDGRVRQHPNAHFHWEEESVFGALAIVRWRYSSGLYEPGSPAQVRGVDLFTARDVEISEKLSYVKD